MCIFFPFLIFSSKILSNCFYFISWILHWTEDTALNICPGRAGKGREFVHFYFSVFIPSSVLTGSISKAEHFPALPPLLDLVHYECCGSHESSRNLHFYTSLFGSRWVGLSFVSMLPTCNKLEFTNLHTFFQKKKKTPVFAAFMNPEYIFRGKEVIYVQIYKDFSRPWKKKVINY